MRKLVLMFFLAMLCLARSASAQSVTVRGKVTSAEDGMPLPGVSVKIKGTSSGTATSSDGSYSITVNRGQVLVFSFIGTVSQEHTISGQNALNVLLRSDAKTLKEAVVTGYGINRDRKTLGYSAPTVTGEEVAQTQRESFFQGLQGRVPGLSINSTSGSPGSSAQIVLRGFVSISGDNNALIVVDGVPVDNSILNQADLVTVGANRDQDYSNRAMDFNPEDIESYTIMKGPEATALYGSRGASGAIIITTKKGKAGRGTITYNNSFRLEKVNKFPSLQNKYNQGNNGAYDPTSVNFLGPAFPEGTTTYDNIHQFFETGFAQKHNVSLEGGTESFTYRWSNEYSDEKGTVPTTEYQRYSSTLTAVGTISPVLKLTSTFRYMNSNNIKANKGLNGYMLSLARFNPSWDINNWIDANGNRVLHISDVYSEYDNPFWDVNKNIGKDKTNRFLGNTSFQLTPVKWLLINGIVGADISTTSGIQVYHPQSYRGSGSASDPTGGSIGTYNRLTRIFNASLTATARHSFGVFNNTYIAGATLSDNNITTDSQYGERFFEQNFYSINNTLPSTQRTATAVSRYRNIGAFAQAVLGYKTLLYITLTGRLDGSSRLMPGDPYFAYPSASMAFNFTDLSFMKTSAPWLNYGKLRLSYAITGKAPWRDYSLRSNFVGQSTTGGGFAYSYTGGNPNLKPETSKNFEVGTELQFMNNRVGLDFNYYKLRSEDQIIQPRISYGSGFVLQMMNGGVVENKGVEVQLTGSPVKNENFNWDITANFTHNKGTVLSIAEELPEYYESDTWVLTGVRSGTHPGASTGALSGLKFDRNIYGDIIINAATGLPNVPSDTRYYPIGDRTPKFTLGLVNRFRYKNVNLSFLWDFRYGGDVLNGTDYINYTRGYSLKTLDREVPRIVKGVLNDGLQNTENPTPNTIAVTPYFNSNYYTTNVAPEMFIEKNIKTIRLRDVTLGYDLPRSFLQKRMRFAQGFGLFVTLTDAVLITNYSGMDPESNSNTPGVGGIGGYGIDLGNIGNPIGVNFGLRMRL